MSGNSGSSVRYSRVSGRKVGLEQWNNGNLFRYYASINVIPRNSAPTFRYCIAAVIFRQSCLIRASKSDMLLEENEQATLSAGKEPP
jgi:hypothetical protein